MSDIIIETTKYVRVLNKVENVKISSKNGTIEIDYEHTTCEGLKEHKHNAYFIQDLVNLEIL